MGGSRKFRWMEVLGVGDGGWGPDMFFLSHQSMNYLQKQLDPRGGGSGPPVPGPSGSAHVMFRL